VLSLQPSVVEPIWQTISGLLPEWAVTGPAATVAGTVLAGQPIKQVSVSYHTSCAPDGDRRHRLRK
jgi:hypothetical protein